jgi:cytochrome b561
MQNGFSRQQIALHWTIAGLVVIQFAAHDGIAHAFDRVADGSTAEVTALVGLHIFTGFTIFALTLVRLALRLEHGAPPPPEAEPPLLRRLSRGVHWAFYALLVALPVSGAVAWFRQNAAAADAHAVMRAVLLGLIVLHLGGVALHRFVWKTDLLARMRWSG